MKGSFEDHEMISDRERWNRRYAEQAELPPPNPLLIEAFDRWIAPRFPHGGRALDLAGGRGQNSIYLLERGWHVKLIDASDAAVHQARDRAKDACLTLDCEVEDAGSFLARNSAGTFDLVMVFAFLDRKLWQGIRRALRSGGLLVYKTYTLDNLQFGRGPSNPDYLLRAGELCEEFSDFEILHSNETSSEPAVAELVAIHR